MWPWRTEEVRDLLVWLRQYNATADLRSHGKVEFAGFDMQNPTSAAIKLRDYAAIHAPEILPMVESAREQLNPSSFGGTAARLPLAAFRGRKLKFSGWIIAVAVRSG